MRESNSRENTVIFNEIGISKMKNHAHYDLAEAKVAYEH